LIFIWNALQTLRFRYFQWIKRKLQFARRRTTISSSYKYICVASIFLYECHFPQASSIDITILLSPLTSSLFHN
jgi:hypothetical protein